MTTFHPQVYVACLASYVAGRLHGRWIDATLDPEEIRAEIREMLAQSEADNPEEYAIHDYDDFGGVSLGEYESLETVARVARFISAHGELGVELLKYLDTIQEAEEVFSEGRYLGCYASLAEYAEEAVADAAGEIPDFLQYYLDYEKLGRDFTLSGDVFVVELGWREVHVFAGY